MFSIKTTPKEIEDLTENVNNTLSECKNLVGTEVFVSSKDGKLLFESASDSYLLECSSKATRKVLDTELGSLEDLVRCVKCYEHIDSKKWIFGPNDTELAELTKKIEISRQGSGGNLFYFCGSLCEPLRRRPSVVKKKVE